MTRTVLVTGAAGFVGRHTVTELEKQGWDVTKCDIRYKGMGMSHMSDFNEVVTWNKKRYDLVIHAAAVAPHRAAIDGQPMTFAQNMQLDAALFHWAMMTKQKRVLYISSSAAYPVMAQTEDRFGWRLAEDEIDLQYPELADGNYGITKLTGEHLAKAAREVDVPVTVVRPFSGYGEDQGTDWPFGAFVQRIRNGDDPFVIWGNTMQRRDWIHIDDVVKGMLKIVEQQENNEVVDGEPVNLCTGQCTAMGDLVMLMAQATGRSQLRIIVDNTKPMGVMNRVGDPTRFFEYYEPKVTIEEGVFRALGRKD